MANNVVNYLIRITTAGQATVDKATDSVDKLDKKVNGANNALKKLGAAAAAYFTVSQISNYVRTATAAYQEEAAAVSSLQQVMRNTMNATNEQTQSILDLASAQQKLGVIGDEVQIAGAAELATYLNKQSSLEKLMPVMNDMIAHQYRYNATQESAQGIATMMGKVMDGQTSALSRYGYTFTEAEEKILKFGNEEQRAATLAEVVSRSVGGVNEALANTPEGRLKQATDRMGDMQEQVGKAWISLKTRLMPAIEGLANLIAGTLSSAFEASGKVIDWVVGIYNKFIQGVRDGNPWLIALSAIIVGITGYMVIMETVTLAVTVVTKLWTLAQWALNVALTANPIGLIIAAIVALIALISYVIYKTDGWGKTWKNTIEFMKLGFEGFKAGLSLRWLQIQDFFMKGIELIEKGWYKLQSLWNKEAATEGLAKLEQQRNDRAQEIAAAQGKVNEIGQQLADMKVWEVTWNKERKLSDLVTATQESLGIAPPVIPGASGGIGAGASDDVKKSTEAVATGGTRSTNINIDIGKMLETVNIYAQDFQDGMKDLEDKVIEAVTRALVTAQSLAR